MDEYKILKECHKDRMWAEAFKRNSYSYQARIEFSLFSIWCRINNLQTTEENFKKYYESEKPQINFRTKLALLENYFNYEVKFDYNKQKWLTKKL